MRVLLINAVSGIRSTGRMCTEIADYLNKSGEECFIAYSAGTPYQKGCRIGSPLDVRIHGLLSRVSGTQAYFSKRATRKLLKFMDDLQPDVVHLHNLHSNYINLRLLAEYLKEKDIPTVLTLHDCWFYTGKCCHYTVDKCPKWKDACGQCPRRKNDNPSWFFDRTEKMLKDKKRLFEGIPRLAVIGVSDWITGEAKKSILQSAKIIRRIYNWIDTEVFRPVEADDLRKSLGLEGRFVVLGVASVWTRDKGLGGFIRLAELLPENMAIVLVGNIGCDLVVPGNIVHVPETHDVAELVKYYSMANVFLNLSSEESFGKVAAEAMACGTPVISNGSTANPELVRPGCGYILEENNIGEIISALKETELQGPDYYWDICMENARKNFSKADRIEDYRAVYREMTMKD